MKNKSFLRSWETLNFVAESCVANERKRAVENWSMWKAHVRADGRNTPKQVNGSGGTTSLEDADQTDKKKKKKA